MKITKRIYLTDKYKMRNNFNITLITAIHLKEITNPLYNLKNKIIPINS